MDPDGCLARWALKLHQYDFTIVHLAGGINQNTNGLSRLLLLAYLAPEDDRVFNLISRPALCHFKPNTIQERFRKMPLTPRSRRPPL